MLELMLGRWQELAGQIKGLAGAVAEAGRVSRRRTQEVALQVERLSQELEEVFTALTEEIQQVERRWLEVERLLQEKSFPAALGGGVVEDLGQVLELLPLKLF